MNLPFHHGPANAGNECRGKVQSSARALAVGLMALALLLVTAVVPASATPPMPIIVHPSHAAVSPRLSDLPAAPWARGPKDLKHMPRPKPLPPPGPGPGESDSSTLVFKTSQRMKHAAQSRASFAGIGANGYIPPDPNIAVGQSEIVQVVNSEVAVFNKSTGMMLGGYPKSLDSLWSGLGGACAANDAGDPVVQYDNLADNGAGRWIITQLGSQSSPYSECIAVSQTSDPSGGYYAYSYDFGDNFNDYPKFGVWPTASNSAYLASYNLFQNGQSFIGAELCAYDRAAMLSGASAPAAICYTRNDGGFLPADLDGATPPPDGTPGYFLNIETKSSLRLYELSPDFASPNSSRLTQVTPDITVTPFEEACNGGTCIPQPNRQKLDSLGDRLMYRLAYRMLGGTPTMVVNHSVVAGSSVGVRWYELQLVNGAFGLAQWGTFAPDSNYRWMGSAAMDKDGDIALGYSESSNTLYPEIAYTGRTPGMTAGQMGAETVLQAGSGAQTNYSRWGDYTVLRIDPSNDKTFWYTNEYYKRNSRRFNYLWSTAIGSFTITAPTVIASSGPNFTLSVAPSALTIRAGSQGAATVTATATADPTSVSLGVSGLPRKTSAGLTRNPVTATGQSTLDVSASRKTPRGAYTITVTGSNASGSQSAKLILNVQ